MTASSSTSAPVKGRLLLPLDVCDPVGCVKGSALDDVDGGTPVELDAIEGGWQLL
jgi:hypothetical protein